MKRGCSFFLSMLLIASMLPVQAQVDEKRAMTTDDGLNMVNVGRPLMSPDGKWVLYSKSELDWDKNKRKTTYHMAPAAGGESF